MMMMMVQAYPDCPGKEAVKWVLLLLLLLEKCLEQYKDLYFIFIDLTKAFDSVNRSGLWAVLFRVGCLDKFVKIVQSFHDGMLASVLDGGIVHHPRSLLPVV